MSTGISECPWKHFLEEFHRFLHCFLTVCVAIGEYEPIQVQVHLPKEDLWYPRAGCEPPDKGSVD